MQSQLSRPSHLLKEVGLDQILEGRIPPGVHRLAGTLGPALAAGLLVDVDLRRMRRADVAQAARALWRLDFERWSQPTKRSFCTCLLGGPMVDANKPVP